VGHAYLNKNTERSLPQGSGGKEQGAERKERLHPSWRPAGFHALVNNPQYTAIMMAAAVFFLMSILIHFPIPNSPSYYSDIVDKFWYGRTVNGIPYVISGIPYVTYNFEYPAVCGLILWLGGWLSGGSAQTYAAVEFGISMAFFLLLTHATYQFLDYLHVGHTRQLIVSIFAPSVLIYGAYNFDIVQTFLVVASLYFFITQRKENVSAAFLGLAVATKLLPVLFVPLFWQELGSHRKVIRYSLVTAAAWAFPNVPFMLVKFDGWKYSYQFVASWGLEDSFLVWIFPNSSTWSIAKDASLALIAVSALSVYYFLKQRPLLTRAFVLTGFFILFSYIAAPQLNLDILPFIALVPVVPISLFYLFEVSDVMIILIWFFIPNSHPTLPGLVQTFALLRQIYLAFIVFLGVFARHRPKF
jgi:hypothetical protein